MAVTEGDRSPLKVSGTIDEHGKLRLDERLPLDGPLRVNVTVTPEETDAGSGEWLHLATADPASDFLGEHEDRRTPEE